MFSLCATYLQHSGGTKFYEAVLIKDKRGPAMLIKRWGKITEGNTGGGQTKIEVGSYSALRDEYNKILAEKRRARSGKGQYLDSTVGFGIHGLSDPNNVKPETLIANLTHYADPNVRNRIDAHFGLGAINDVDDIVEATGEDVNFEPEPEPDRGTGWGSW